MKAIGLPDRPQLREAYEILQWKTRSPSPSDLTTWAQWSRVDPRLAEILVRFMEHSFYGINPLLLWETNRASALPQALCLLIEFTRIRAKRNLKTAEFKTFEVWRKTVRNGIPPAPPQAFFIFDGMPRPARAIDEAQRSLRPYRRWGFFGSTPIGVEKLKPNPSTLLGKRERSSVLETLIELGSSITVSDYIRACEGRIHRRTAERDLKMHPRLQAKGFTRSRIYKKRKSH